MLGALQEDCLVLHISSCFLSGSLQLRASTAHRPSSGFQLRRKVHAEQRAGEKPGPLHPDPLGTSPTSDGASRGWRGRGRSLVLA